MKKKTEVACTGGAAHKIDEQPHYFAILLEKSSIDI